MSPADAPPGGARILVAGPARSGTTWIAQGLAAGTGARLVHEPDNPRYDPASWASLGQGRYPLLARGDHAPTYGKLWDLAFKGGWSFPERSAVAALARRSRLFGGRGVPILAALNRLRPGGPSRVLVKTVFGANSVEWIAERYAPEVVLVRRKVLSVVASWKQLGWTDAQLPGMYGRPTLDDLQRRFPFIAALSPIPRTGSLGACAWWIAMHHQIQDHFLARNPSWLMAEHDQLCLEPMQGFQHLLRQLKIQPRPDLELFLSASNDTAGDVYGTRRLTADQPDNWLAVLSNDEVAEVRGVLEAFPAAGRAGADSP